MSILLTGSTGFIATHVLDQLLEKNLSVVATYRSESKVEPLKKRFAGKDVKFVLLSDIESESEVKAIFDKNPEIKKVIHTASPFHFNFTDPLTQVLQPAVNGTKAVLGAIPDHVTHVVVTSSVAAVIDVKYIDDYNHIITEDSWNGISWEDAEKKGGSFTYRGSKTFAEKAAWELHKTAKYNLVTILPPLVFGPVYGQTDTLNTSNEQLVDALRKGSDFRYAGTFVDVRDTAAAHVAAIDADVSARWLTIGGYYTRQEILDIANKEFPELGADKGTPGDYSDSKRAFRYDNSKTNKVFPRKYIALKQTVGDTLKGIDPKYVKL
ncbi:putative NADPH-dependent methylglyoxal reductase GRP2 [Yarrowia sp. C11]|nr:putative NADPH-dependent methylglyoxal reductase GRP2 [Yarrowia sp. C11]KAG5364613.1 putative NADPH-dependent methylglyoxal reductase GRP2 [Yarrowia sp. E02]